MKLSKDPITATLLARDIHDADMVYWLFEENAEAFPELFEKFTWLHSLKRYPVELYLIFPNKRKYGKFMRALGSANTTVKILAKY